MIEELKIKRVLYATSVLATMAWTGPAIAQTATADTPAGQTREATSATDDIIVTARRRAEAAQDTPVSVAALSGDALEQRGIERPSELGTAVPGVFSAPGTNRGNQSPVFAVRGQLNRDPSLAADPSVGFYFAEVPWARPQGANASFVDLESVQVVKGPQGTLFGRNSTAGAILVTPKAPTDRFEGYVKGTIGSYDLAAVEGVVNIPLGETLAARFVAARERREGFLRAQTGQMLNDVNNISLRGTLRYEPSDAFTTSVIAGYYNSDTNGEGSRIYLITPVAPSAFAASLRPLFATAIQRTQEAGRFGFLTSYSPATPNSLLPAQVAKAKTWNVQNNSTLDLGELGFLGEVTLKNIISYREEADFTTFDSVGIDFIASATLADQSANQFSEELQLQGSTGSLDYILGAFYFRESGTEFARSFAASPVLNIIDATVVNTSYSAFVHGTYKFTPELSFSAGLRFNNDKRYWRGANRRATTPGLTAPLFTCNFVPTAPANNGSQCAIEREVTFREPTWSANLSYQFSDRSMVFVNVARGYRSGGFSLSAGNLAGAEPFLPEKVLSYEIGTKNDFSVGNWDIRFNGAAFYTDYKGIQRTLNFINPASNALINRTTNASSARIFGTEVDLTVRPADGIELTLSHAYLDPKYREFNDIFAGTTVDISDSTFILVSKHSLNAGVAFTIPSQNGMGDLTLRASYYYRTGFFTSNDINTPNCNVPGQPSVVYTPCYHSLGRLPGYGLVNARADWKNVFGSEVTASLFVNNLTNKYYYYNSANVLGGFGVSSGFVGAPRMVGFSLSVPFTN